MSVITLLSDFGAVDEYVGVMKGVILSINPSATVVDISHQIDPQDLVQAAFMITSYYQHFPPGTIHLTVVDPGVGSDRRILAVAYQGHTFISPDNGILTVLLHEGSADNIICLDNPDFYKNPVSQTFHGRDIFAPVAAHLSLGVNVSDMGTLIDASELCLLDVALSGKEVVDELIGKIVSIDRFGNLITNIRAETMERFCSTNKNIIPAIWLNNQKIVGLSPNYSSNQPEDPLAIIGSRGYLEISVYSGNAQQYFKAGKGDTVCVTDLKKEKRGSGDR